MNKISSADYVRNFTRDNDYNLYLVHFFMPKALRADALALMALHAELKTIPVKARDPSMIVIRLKWWYDNVMALFNGEAHADSPVLEQLHDVIKKHNLSKHDFESYFERFETVLGGGEGDPDEGLYILLGRLIDNQRQKERFSRALQYHDQLPENAPFRALRLWIKYKLT